MAQLLTIKISLTNFENRKRHLKSSKHVKINPVLVDSSMRFRLKKTKFTVKKKSVPFSFLAVNFFFQKRLICSVNVLKINGLCRSLTDTSVNFRKPPFVNGTLPSPRMF